MVKGMIESRRTSVHHSVRNWYELVMRPHFKAGRSSEATVDQGIEFSSLICTTIKLDNTLLQAHHRMSMRVKTGKMNVGWLSC